MPNPYRLFLDRRAGKLLRSTDPYQLTSLQEAITAGDDSQIPIELIPLDALDGGGYEVASYATDDVRIAIGNPEEQPTSGTFVLDHAAYTSEALYVENLNADSLERGLNGITSIHAAGGVQVISAGQGYVIKAISNGVLGAITADEISLAPHGTVKIIELAPGTATTKAKYQINLVSDPYALLTSWAAISAAAIAISTTKAGTTTQFETQTISITGAVKGGYFTITDGTTVSASIAYDAGAAAVEDAVNGVLGASTVTVTKPNSCCWDIRWAAVGNQDVLTITSAITSWAGLAGTIQLNTVSLASSIAGKASIPAIAQIIETISASDEKHVYQESLEIKETIIANATLTTIASTLLPGLKGGAVFTSGTRSTEAPLYIGQVGIETDTGLTYRSYGTEAGNWEITADLRVGTMAELLLLDSTYLPDGKVAVLYEYTAATGFGGGTFTLDKSGDAAVGDTGTVVAAVGGSNWYWRRQFAGIAIPDFYGAVRDDATVDNAAAITECLKINQSCLITGTYHVSSRIGLVDGAYLVGEDGHLKIPDATFGAGDNFAVITPTDKATTSSWYYADAISGNDITLHLTIFAVDQRLVYRVEPGEVALTGLTEGSSYYVATKDGAVATLADAAGNIITPGTLTGASNAHSFSPCVSNATIRGITFDLNGNGQTGNDMTLAAIQLSGNNNTVDACTVFGMQATESSECFCISVSDIGSQGGVSVPGTGSAIINCTAHSPSLQDQGGLVEITAFHVNSKTSLGDIDKPLVRLTGCKAYSATRSATMTSYFRALSFAGKSVIVANNYVSDVNAGIRYNAFQECRDVLITGNVIRNCMTGISLACDHDENRISDVLISDNVITFGATYETENAGIALSLTTPTVPDATLRSECRNITIRGNKIIGAHDVGDGSITTMRAIRVQDLTAAADMDRILDGINIVGNDIKLLSYDTTVSNPIVLKTAHNDYAWDDSILRASDNSCGTKEALGVHVVSGVGTVALLSGFHPDSYSLAMESPQFSATGALAAITAAGIPVYQDYPTSFSIGQATISDDDHLFAAKLLGDGVGTASIYSAVAVTMDKPWSIEARIAATHTQSGQSSSSPGWSLFVGLTDDPTVDPTTTAEAAFWRRGSNSIWTPWVRSSSASTTGGGTIATEDAAAANKWMTFRIQYDGVNMLFQSPSVARDFQQIIAALPSGSLYVVVGQDTTVNATAGAAPHGFHISSLKIKTGLTYYA
jgi:hypothetical protein